MEAVLEQTDQTEYERQARLEEERAKDERKEAESIKRALGKLVHFRRSVPHVGFVEWVLMLLAGVLDDILDYSGIGLIPILFDIIDLGEWSLISIWVWVRGIRRPPAVLFSGVIELIPFGDLIPTWSLMVLGIVIYNNSVRRLGEKRLKNVIAKIKNTNNS